MRLLLPVFFSFALQAADAPIKVPAEIEAEYYRADAHVAHMKADWDAANADLSAAVIAVQKACGDKVVTVEGKHLVCTPKPEPPPKEVPTK